jgi:hypothetical protein
MQAKRAEFVPANRRGNEHDPNTLFRAHSKYIDRKGNCGSRLTTLYLELHALVKLEQQAEQKTFAAVPYPA